MYPPEAAAQNSQGWPPSVRKACDLQGQKKIPFLAERGRVDSVDIAMENLRKQTAAAEEAKKGKGKYGKLGGNKKASLTNAEMGRKALVQRQLDRKRGTKKGVFDSADHFMKTGASKAPASAAGNGYRKTAKHFVAEEASSASTAQTTACTARK